MTMIRPDRKNRHNRRGLSLTAALGVLAILAGIAVACLDVAPPTSPPTADSAPPPKAKPIEQLRLGDRVVTGNPQMDASELAAIPEIVPANWRAITLTMRKADGGRLDIELLRSVQWIEDYQAKPGGRVYMDLFELGAVGPATVIAISPCPPLTLEDPTKPSQIVTGTFRHDAANVVDLAIHDGASGERTTIGTTATHPFWSADADDFVPAGHLRSNERLKTLQGHACVVSIIPRAGPETVYNLEVNGEHIYHVGPGSVLVHNGCEQQRNALGQFMKKGQQGDAAPGSSSVDDFAAHAEGNGFDVMGREVSVNTPYGQRRYDLVIRNRQTRAITGVEIKSSQAAMARFDAGARQQLAADRWLNTRGGADAIGKLKGTRIEDTIKILWEVR